MQTPLLARLSKHITPQALTGVSLTPTHTFKTEQNRRNTSVSCWLSVQVGLDRLDQSIDIVTEKAGNLFYNSEYKSCIKVLDEILKADPYHCPALIILIGCLMELKEYNSEWFSLAISKVSLLIEVTFQNCSALHTN